jgi:hypothetical protein
MTAGAPLPIADQGSGAPGRGPQAPERAGTPTDAAAEDRLMLALTTEHFTLQTARSATISESAGRAALFLFMVSSGIVALAFAGQSSDLGAAFDLLALTILPALVLLGSLTYLRLVQSAVEDLRLAAEIDRVRARYRGLAPGADLYFRPLLHLDGGGGGIRHLASHSASTVLVVVGLLAGGAAALGVRAAGSGLAVAASAGVVATVATAAALLLHQILTWRRATWAVVPGEPPTPGGRRHPSPAQAPAVHDAPPSALLVSRPS